MIRPDDLFSYAAREAKDDGMARVEANAEVIWKRAARLAVLKTAQELALFTSDDVMDRIVGAWTHDLRALGPIMMGAAKSGWIRKEDCAPWPSRRASLHASPRAVWHSLLKEGAPS